MESETQSTINSLNDLKFCLSKLATLSPYPSVLNEQYQAGWNINQD